MEIEQKAFRIGELALYLSIEQFVIRFWEKEFNIKPKRSKGGQRFYTSKHIEKFKKIKSLLYEKKFTIKGARLAIQENSNYTQVADSQQTPMTYPCHENFRKQLLSFRERLIKFNKLL